jgi:hypothetical protein
MRTVVTVVAIFTMDHIVDVFNMILAVVTVVAMGHFVDVFNMILAVVTVSLPWTILLMCLI